MKEVKNLYSILLGFFNVYSVVCVVPYITDNSSENLRLEDGNWSGPRNSRESEWLKGAFNYVRNLKCEDVFFTTEKECRELLTVPQTSYVVLVAPFSGHRTYEAVLPEEVLTRKHNNHQGVLVLDPYPTANFGHLVIVFFIDYKDKTTCDSENGIYLGKLMYYIVRRKGAWGVIIVSIVGEGIYYVIRYKFLLWKISVIHVV